MFPQLACTEPDETVEHGTPPTGAAQFLFGFRKFGWLKMLYRLAPTVTFTRSVAWKSLPKVKSELKNPGPRYWLRISLGKNPRLLALASCAALKHALVPFTQLCCAWPEHLYGDRRASVLCGGCAVCDGVRQAAAHDEALRKQPPAEESVPCAAVKVIRVGPDIIRVKRVPHVVVGIAVVIGPEVQGIDLPLDRGSAQGRSDPFEISSSVCDQV